MSHALILPSMLRFSFVCEFWRCLLVLLAILNSIVVLGRECNHINEECIEFDCQAYRIKYHHERVSEVRRSDSTHLCLWFRNEHRWSQNQAGVSKIPFSYDVLHGNSRESTRG